MEVEAVELVAGLLRVGYVFIDNKCGSLGVVGDTLSNLAAQTVSTKFVKRIFLTCFANDVLA